MGLSLEFYGGYAQTIGVVFSEVEFDKVRDGRKSMAYANLSLHLSTEDLDVLSAVVSEHLDAAPRCGCGSASRETLARWT